MSEIVSKTCLPFQEEIVRLAFQECSFWRRLAVQRHLRTCPDCRALYASYQSTAQELRALPYLSMPSSVRARALAVTVNRSKAAGRQPVWQWACLSVMTVLACLAIYRYSTRPPLQAYSPDEVLRAKAQVQTALGVWGKAMAETRTSVVENLLPSSIDRPVQNSLYLALKPFKTGE